MKGYGSLPPAFGAALDGARAKVEASPSDSDAVRSLARLYEANRLNDEALQCYSLLATESGGLTAQDHYYLSDIDLYRGDNDLALPELEQVERMAPEYLAARLGLAEVYFKTGKSAEAEREYVAITVMIPNQPQAMYGLARIDLMKRDDTKAVARLEALLTVHPEMTSAAALLAQIFARRSEMDRAALMTQWSRQKPEPIPPDPWMDALLFDCYDVQRLSLKFEEYFTSGEIDAALPLLNRVEQLDPRSPIPQLLRGWSQARDHNDAEAVREYRMALDKGGDPEKICPYMVQSLINLGRLPDAEALMAEFYARKPDSVPILIAYSDVAVRQGNTSLAKVLLRKVLEKEPYRAAANLNLAKILWASGERDEAAACLARVVKVSSSDVVARALLGEYYLRKDKFGAAVAPLEQALALAQKQTPSYASLESMLYAAYLGAGDNDDDGAIKFCDKAMALEPANPAAYGRKATLCARLRRFAEAAGTLDQLRVLQPNNPTIYLSLGDVLYHSGKEAAARDNWRRALELTSPSNGGLRAALEARLTGPITEGTFD